MRVNPLWLEPCAMHKCHPLKLKENGSDPTSILFFRCIPNYGCSKNTTRGDTRRDAVYSVFGLDLPSFVRRACGETCINRHKVNNSTQLNFTIRTGNEGSRRHGTSRLLLFRVIKKKSLNITSDDVLAWTYPLLYPLYPFVFLLFYAKT